jgi:heme/copper-type cytochrome/quinol oxidase subunit 3
MTEQSSLRTINKSKNQQHPFHLLGSSKLPVFMATFAGGLASTVIIKLQNVSNLAKFLTVGSDIMEPFFAVSNAMPSTELPDSIVDARILQFLVLILITMWSWARELVREATFEGHHTKYVQVGLGYGMLLFLASEAMLFFPFFWSFFHASLSPAITVGGVWPPEGIRFEETLDAFMLPFVNTVVLLTSGVALVAAHRAILGGYKPQVVNGLYIAISLGILFSWLQYLEYGLTHYTITDGLFGSTFFMLTGLHGFHVIVGTILLLIAYWRAVQNHFSRQHHALFEFAAWYWHFVDVVWLFVFAFLYVWNVDQFLTENNQEEQFKHWFAKIYPVQDYWVSESTVSEWQN